MKRNKLVSIAAITVALGVLATGCAGGSGSSKSESKSSGGTKTVTVKAGTGANVKPYTFWNGRIIIRHIYPEDNSRELRLQEHLRWSRNCYFSMSRHLHWIRSL